MDLSVAAFAELHDCVHGKGIALGCNVECVSRAKAEIDASVDMVQRLAAIVR